MPNIISSAHLLENNLLKKTDPRAEVVSRLHLWSSSAFVIIADELLQITFSKLLSGRFSEFRLDTVELMGDFWPHFASSSSSSRNVEKWVNLTRTTTVARLSQNCTKLGTKSAAASVNIPFPLIWQMYSMWTVDSSVGHTHTHTQKHTHALQQQSNAV